MSSLFDSDDIQLMQNAEFIERKNALLKEFIELLAAHGENLQQTYGEAFAQSPLPKVNRGENYKGFPYLVMDFPRVFSKQHVFAFRTLFWWGHFVSCTLHLKGDFLNDYSERIPQLINLSKQSDLQIRCSIQGNEWNHNALSDEYFDPQKLSTEQQMDFFKLTTILPLHEINCLHDFLDESHKRILYPLI